MKKCGVCNSRQEEGQFGPDCPLIVENRNDFLTKKKIKEIGKANLKEVCLKSMRSDLVLSGFWMWSHMSRATRMCWKPEIHRANRKWNDHIDCYRRWWSSEGIAWTRYDRSIPDWKFAVSMISDVEFQVLYDREGFKKPCEDKKRFWYANDTEKLHRSRANAKCMIAVRNWWRILKNFVNGDDELNSYISLARERESLVESEYGYWLRFNKHGARPRLQCSLNNNHSRKTMKP